LSNRSSGGAPFEIPRRWISPLLLVVAAFGGACVTVGRPVQEPSSFDTAVKLLTRPLPGPFVALYRLRVPSTGGLRLSVIADGGQGRITVSENLGGALVLAGWDHEGSAIFDLRKGCRLEGKGALEALGLGSLPLDRAVLVLGGRAPAIEGDRVGSPGTRGMIEISADDWWAIAEIETDPVRILSLRGQDWAVDLGNHTSSLPGRFRFESAGGDWAELELIRLQWEYSGDLPQLPDFPRCGDD